MSDNDRLPTCKNCAGKGSVRPMFHDLECVICCGTGLDISEPIETIKHAQRLLVAARKVIVEQRQNILLLTTTEEDRESGAIDAFYAKCKRFD